MLIKTCILWTEHLYAIMKQTHSLMLHISTVSKQLKLITFWNNHKVTQRLCTKQLDICEGYHDGEEKEWTIKTTTERRLPLWLHVCGERLQWTMLSSWTIKQKISKSSANKKEKNPIKLPCKWQ